MLRHNGAAAFGVVSPDTFINAFPIKDLAGILGKQADNGKIFFGEGKLPAGGKDLSSAIVDDQAVREFYQGGRCVSLFPAQMGSYAGLQLQK